jgi:hypothetical protein
MSPSESTETIGLERPTSGDGDGQRPSQTTDAWSFGFRERLFAPLTPQAPADPATERSAAANTIGWPTLDPAAPVISDLKPIALLRPNFGKRGFAPLYRWEGVVEKVNGEGFRARLRPFEQGQAEPSRVEYADFSYDDLADESDHDLVAEGAVFYWTVGKSRNEYGAYTNTSLVRFRRLPPPTPYQKREAAREAEALLADLEGGSST